MTQETAQKYSYWVNTIILFIVIGLAVFFWMLDVPFLVIFSIPTALVYIVGYFLIYKGLLAFYVWMIYLWISIYMGVTTICLGYGFGFHLYCMSMIPIMFVTEYLAYKLKARSVKALYVSLAVCVVYLISTGFVSNLGPIYKTDESAAKIFWLLNSIIVFSFLIFYTNWMLNLVKESNEKLEAMAHIDKLTGLYNRHYMTDLLEGTASIGATFVEITAADKNDLIAMADIDHFKSINDTYGHNAGDYCLQTLADILKKSSDNITVGRWGGEEFLIYLPAEIAGIKEDYFENLRKTVETSDFIFEGKKIQVTITIGVAKRDNYTSIDKWIQKADENLYIGKNNGRNKVVA
jgi:diguanylate cyclase (GGDEF)-like protein